MLIETVKKHQTSAIDVYYIQSSGDVTIFMIFFFFLSVVSSFLFYERILQGPVKSRYGSIIYWRTIGVYYRVPYIDR